VSGGQLVCHTPSRAERLMSKLLKWIQGRAILLLAALTPACREITRLASREFAEPRPVWTTFRLRVHLRICGACERYLRQLDLLHAAAAESVNHSPEAAHSRLAPEAKERLKRRLRCERVG